ncbi:hypothetical protein EIKCOROL_02048 [Eikenella corrodens ATCC 23834]|uniref:Uncharacterized protein n=1 Tax=Eikenella corrodens ATCC 23834 TaxID=546274 RepID=C0DXE2_EIKCO|nr:hypothetical protein EIKCOROL_02048 [Eikenella corrodens ATCC 23834]
MIIGCENQWDYSSKPPRWRECELHQFKLGMAAGRSGKYGTAAKQ